MKSSALNEVLVQRLSFFSDKDESVCIEFCRVATNFLKIGINAKLYASAAAKLGVDAESVKLAVEAIMTVLTEAAKVKATESDLRNTLANAVSTEALIENITSAYLDIAPALCQSLETSDVFDAAVPEYKSLNWRFEIEVASRAARQLYRPVITLNLATVSDQIVQNHLLQTDAATLVQITQDLEHALKEIKAREYRKLTNQVSK